MLSELEGNIESVIYTSVETGYTVARVKTTDGKLVTVVGNLLSPVPGEKISMKGCWDMHPRFGRQFKISEYKTSAPATVQGIERYLGSGLVPGIGRVMAGRIVKKFGAETLDVLENESKKLLQVEGIGRMRIEKIRRACFRHRISNRGQTRR
jgi:exodeoxyribonuclease V alpha subunit